MVTNLILLQILFPKTETEFAEIHLSILRIRILNFRIMRFRILTLSDKHNWLPYQIGRYRTYRLCP